MSDQPAPSVIPPNPHIQHAQEQKPAKRLAEMGGLMVCAPVEITVSGPDGRPMKLKASLMDILLQIAQGSGNASMVHPVSRQEEGRDVVVNTSSLQLLAEIADSLNDLCCMGQELLEAQGVDEDDEDDEELPRPPRRKR
jgi:hypothetical protein